MSQFCTCHDIWAVVTYAKLWPDGPLKIKIIASNNFHKISIIFSWIMCEMHSWEIAMFRIRFMWPPWGLPGSCRSQVGPMLAPWTLLSGCLFGCKQSIELRGGHSQRFSDMRICTMLFVVRRQNFMMTSSNGNIFRVTGHLCTEFTGPRWIPRTQRPVTQSFDVFFDLRLNKRLSKQSWGWWFETISRPLLVYSSHNSI